MLKLHAVFIGYFFRLKCLICLTLIAFSSVGSIMAQHKKPAKQNYNQVFLNMMDVMMQQMDAVPMGTSADVDFILMMRPHHQGAVAMARYEILHGQNFEMIQLAKSILAEQQIDLQQMELWLTQHQKVKSPANSNYKTPLMQTMETMMENLPSPQKISSIDRAFAMVMLPHHQAAIDMAKVELSFGLDKIARRIAEGIISAEEVEIEQMQSFINH